MPYFNPDAEELPPLHVAIQRTWNSITARGQNNASDTEIGMRAWSQLTFDERLSQIPFLLGCYVRRVFDEEAAKRMVRAAEDRTHTYLDEHDMASAWDSAMGDPDHHGDVEVSRESLINILCEVELLQHRLAMRDREDAA